MMEPKYVERPEDYGFSGDSKPQKLQINGYPGFDKIPALAARLGVPEDDGTADCVVSVTLDGPRWDLYRIINALLDRIDAATAKPQETPAHE